MKNKLQNKRTEIIEIILVSIVIAFGINFISTSIMSLLNIKNSKIVLLIGIIICLIVILYYILSMLRSLNIKKEIEGNFIISKKTNRIIGINEYLASMFMNNYLEAILLEDTKVLKKYNKEMEKLDYFCEGYSNIDGSYFKNIIDELLEYCIIHRFTDAKHIKDKKIKIINTNNVDKQILDNIFIKTFSKDMNKRVKFKDIQCDTDEEEGELYTLITDDGCIYDKFKIRVPKNVKFYKKDKNTLIIKSIYFKINISWNLEYASLASNYEFYNYFSNIKVDKWNDINFTYYIDINVKYKLPIIILKKFDEYYMWIDDIINNLINYFDYDKCLKQNNWILLKNIKKLLNN